MREFIEDCLRTESSYFQALTDKDANVYDGNRLIHAAFGMQTESAEFTDALKKSLFYGKELDVVNLKEEIGDMLWYMAIALDELGSDFDSEMARVVNKLKQRYPEKFTQKNAVVRDLGKERKILEDMK
jgi:NTP pyrophosphatase (non-canonical NTP hydrolase)